ncbi:MAG TPA: DUF58 domain-containing protein [Abditibacteriaceae bacterium]|jgi:uncharacterized protein (DUF58 family)
MITQRAVIIGLVGGCFYLITIVNSLPSYFYVLTWLAASVLASCFGLALLSLQGLGCRWHVERKSAVEDAEGEKNEGHIATGPMIGIELTNTGTLNKTGLVLEVHLRSASDSAAADIVRRFLVEALPSRGHIISEVTIPNLVRGRYFVRDVRVVGSDVLGLFRASKRVKLPRDMAADASLAARSELLVAARRTKREIEERLAAAEHGTAELNKSRRKDSSDEPRHAEVLVGPATVSFGRNGTGVSREAAGGETAASDLTGRGDELRGTRPYVAGDDLRSVHWKSTARLGQLVVREFDRTTRAENVVIWDGGVAFEDSGLSGAQKMVRRLSGKTGRRRKRRAARRSVQRVTALEQGLRFTASLCRALAESGKPCALLRLDSEPLWIPAPRRAMNLAIGQFGDALAIADANRTSSLTDALAVFLRHVPPGSDVWLVTALRRAETNGQANNELRRAVHALRRLGTNVTIVHVQNVDVNEVNLEFGSRSVTLHVTPDDFAAPDGSTQNERADNLQPLREALVASLDARPVSMMTNRSRAA